MLGSFTSSIAGPDTGTSRRVTMTHTSPSFAPGAGGSCRRF
jgi:hypothetical protein